MLRGSMGAASLMEGFLFEEEGEKLEELAALATCPIVEIGSFKGLSTSWLANGAKETGNTVYAVNTFQGSPEHKKDPDILRYGSTYLAFFRAMEDLGYWDIVRPVVAKSLDAVKVWTTPIGLLFIDGDHSMVREDYEAWSPLVVLGGTIAFHDYENSVHPQVTNFIDELLLKSGDVEFTERCCSLMIFKK